MDHTHLNQLAKQLHTFLKPQLGPAFKLGQAQDLIAALPGLRNWPEVRAFPQKLEGLELNPQTLERLSRRIEERFQAQVSPQALLDALGTGADASGDMGFRFARRALVGGPIPSQWICDVCHQLIESVDHGYVIWKSESRGPDHSFKIVHQSTCDLDDHDSSNALRDYVGLDGLNNLLSFLSPGPVRLRFEKTPRVSIPDLDDFVDFIRRLQIPNYDLARSRFRHPQFLEDFREANEVLPYRIDTLKRALENRNYDD